MTQTPPTSEEVQSLLAVSFTADQINAAIDDAQLMLSDSCTYTDPRYTSIIKYLAAHLLSSTQAGSQGNVKSESVDGVSHSFGGATLGQGLKGSTYGQQALLMDINGCLSGLDKSTVKMKLL